MELLVKINKKLEQRRAILNTIIQNVGIQNKILKSAQILAECLKLGGKIITAGNGGSASQSEHFSSEMMGRLKNSRTPFPSLSLSSNASLLTCIGNDFGFERIFSRQIEGIGTTKDVFIAFTTSCKSRNIIEALNVCKSSNIKSIVFTGQCVHDIDLLAEEIIMIPSNDVQIIQECHDIISHIVCELVEEIVDLKTVNEWEQIKNEFKNGYKFLILDRDGVVNITKPNGYISSFSIVENNIKLTIRLYEFCKNNHIRFIYASSASTYGDGGKGYIDSDDIEYLNQLSPLNPYAWSKNYVDKYISYDRYVNKNKSLSVGLKFFNVYGPNEYHKGLQASVIFHFFLQMLQNNTVNLFKSNCADFKDGQQKRDFVYVRDCVDVIIWMLEHQEIIGLFNVGTGCASSFLEVVESIKRACHIECKIHYIDMPEKLKKHYQNFTEANLMKLRSVGYTKEFTSLEAGISQYVNEFLNKKNKRYEPNYI